MSQLNRLLLALTIVLIDGALFFAPLAALFIAYVIVMNPPWVRAFLNGLDSGSGTGPDAQA